MGRELHGSNAGHIGANVSGKNGSGVRAVSSRVNDFSTPLFAMEYQGSAGDHTRVTHDFSIDVSSTFTFEFWWRTTDNSSSHYVVDKEIFGSGWGFRSVPSAGNNFIEFRLDDGSTANQQQVSVNYADGNWNHFALVRDGNSQKIYFNGALQADANVSSIGAVSNTQDLLLGNYLAQNFGGVHEIAHARLWNTARTQTEIQNNANTVLTGAETGLVAYYPTDKGRGSTLTDNAGNNDGTINGATWVERSAFPQI